MSSGVKGETSKTTSTAIPAMSSSGDGFTVSSTRDATAIQQALKTTVANVITQSGKPTVMAARKHAAYWASMCTLGRANSVEDKAELKTTLLTLAIMHGVGTNVDNANIEVHTSKGAWKMDKFIDGIMGKEQSRKFFAFWSDDVKEIFDASPEIRNVISERAIRAGIPITESICVIDFYRPAHASPLHISLRVTGRQNAVNRQQAASRRGDGHAESAAEGLAESNRHGNVLDL